MVRRAAGEVTESRDADSTLEGENIGARRPGERELGGKKILMGMVYSRVISPAESQPQRNAGCRLTGNSEGLAPPSSGSWKAKASAKKAISSFLLFPESGSSSLSSRVIGEQAVHGKPPTRKRRNLYQAIETL